MRVSTDKALNDAQVTTLTVSTDKTRMLGYKPHCIYSRSLDASLLTQSFRIKLINVMPSNKQTVALEHLFETIIKPIVTTVTQKDISLNYYASWLRLGRE